MNLAYELAARRLEEARGYVLFGGNPNNGNTLSSFAYWGSGAPAPDGTTYKAVSTNGKFVAFSTSKAPEDKFFYKIDCLPAVDNRRLYLEYPAKRTGTVSPVHYKGDYAPSAETADTSDQYTTYKGKKDIVIALHYACEAKSGTWQIKELTVKEGTPTVEPGTPDTPSTTEGISVNGLTVTLTNSGATAGKSLKVEDLSTLKLDANPTEFTLSDGTIFKLDSNGNKTKPAYNEKAKELRIYANNIMTITGSKNIAKIILTCTHDNNKNTDCVGNETATIKFSGKTATYTNVFTGTTGGGVQLRIKSIEIVYAK